MAPKPTRRFLARKVPESKYSKFSAGVDALVAKRKELKDPNYGRPKIRGRQFTSAKLAKVSKSRVDKFGRNLDLYKEGGKKAPNFPGIHGGRGRQLSPKALSKVSPRKLKKFDKMKTK